MLTIRVEGVALQTRIGWYDWERQQTQALSVDLVLDVERAQGSDELADTVDYAEVVSLLRRCAEREFRLLERLAEVLRDELLGLPRVRRVEVVLHKPLAAALLGARSLSVGVRGDRQG